MLKRLKHLKKVGIYRDFIWTDNSACFKKYNAIYGFNGSGKSTLARVFRSIDGSKLEHRESGTSAIFEDFGGNAIEIKDDVKHYDVLVYDEDFISEHFKWDQGIKSFVVIGKKSKEDEDKLSELGKQKESHVTNKKVIEASQKQIGDLIADHATRFASDLRKELIQFNSGKFNTYNKRGFLSDFSRFQTDASFEFDRSHLSDLKEKISRTKLDTVAAGNSSTLSIRSIFEQALKFIDRQLPTQIEANYSQKQIDWLEVGLQLHSDRGICLFCENDISEQRKIRVKTDITNEVAEFIREGKSFSQNLTAQVVAPPSLQSKAFYSEFKVRFEDAYLCIQETLNVLNEIKNEVIVLLERKICFEDISSGDLIGRLATVCTNIDASYSDLESVINDNNTLTAGIETLRKQSIENIEKVFFNEYSQQIRELETRLDAENKKHLAEEESLRSLNAKISEIETSLQSEAQAVLGINGMLSIFLGRADLKLEYREKDKKFEIVRKGVPAKRLSEGEKTAITVCYFLILVNSNPDAKKDLLVVVDDPISSLDSNNLYNAYAVLKRNLDGVKQLFVLTHNLYFFRLVHRWFGDFGDQCGYFNVEVLTSGGQIDSSILQMKKLAKETSTEYILLYSHLKMFVKRSEEITLNDSDFLPYPNMLRRLIEAYLYTKQPGAKNNDFEKELIGFGVDADVAKKADRFCNDFSHSRFDSVYGQEGKTIADAPAVVKATLTELERIDPSHFNSMRELIYA